MTAFATEARLSLHAETAADLMVSNPVSIREDASLHEALVLFTTKGFSAAPVIDSAGKPIGVVSHSDIVVHDRTKIEWGKESQQSNADATKVTDLMTPVVFSVSPESSAAKVVQEMSGLNVHRLFVVDEAGVLVGVISSLDIVRHLHQ